MAAAGGDVDDGPAGADAAGGLLGAQDVADEVDVDDAAQVVGARSTNGPMGLVTPALLTRPVSGPSSAAASNSRATGRGRWCRRRR